MINDSLEPTRRASMRIFYFQWKRCLTLNDLVESARYFIEVLINVVSAFQTYNWTLNCRYVLKFYAKNSNFSLEFFSLLIGILKYPLKLVIRWKLVKNSFEFGVRPKFGMTNGAYQWIRFDRILSCKLCFFCLSNGNVIKSDRETPQWDIVRSEMTYRSMKTRTLANSIALVLSIERARYFQYLEWTFHIAKKHSNI